jgi:hypothetical protein
MKTFTCVLVTMILACPASGKDSTESRKNEEQVVGIIVEINNTCYFRENKDKAGSKLDPKNDRNKELSAGQQLRCEPGSSLKIYFYKSKNDRIIQNQKWYKIPNVPATRPAMDDETCPGRIVRCTLPVNNFNEANAVNNSSDANAVDNSGAVKRALRFPIRDLIWASPVNDESGARRAPVFGGRGLNITIKQVPDLMLALRHNSERASSFDLPNSHLRFPGIGAGEAIVLWPSRPNVGTVRGAVFRPAVARYFGFPDGIPPHVVLATNTLPPTILSKGITMPATFTTAPVYLPDAPFINRLWGESAFSSFVASAKWRWTGPNNPLGVGIIPFYRFYPDKADDLSGFNQMQRGSGPGGDIGDFGLIFFLDARLSRSVNVSVNGGYILNSNPKGSFPSGEFTLLGRPDEFLAGIAFDFPINKYIQPVLELRSTQYVGGRTPNAFENSPVDALADVKFYPKRWMGFGLAYRLHLNQQDRSIFEGNDANTTVFQITNVNPPGPQPITVIPATTVPATIGGFPRVFRESDDVNGFIGQFWIGRRNARTPEFLPNQPPTVTLSASSGTIVRPCPPGTISTSGKCPATDNSTVQLSANAIDPDGDTLLYTYTTTGGRVTGDGANVSWDLSGVQPGTYTATVEVDDGCGAVAFSSTTVTIAECQNCEQPPTRQDSSCPDTCKQDTSVTTTGAPVIKAPDD